jgi:hypothetical protein
MVLCRSTAKTGTSFPLPDLDVAAALTGPSASMSSGMMLQQTASGNSLGSLGHYSMDWNKADELEVSSSTLKWSPGTKAGPSQLGTKMHIAKLALLEADRAAEVNIFPLHYFHSFCLFSHFPLVCLNQYTQ